MGTQNAENKLHEFYYKICYNKLADDFVALECLNGLKIMPDTKFKSFIKFDINGVGFVE